MWGRRATETGHSTDTSTVTTVTRKTRAQSVAAFHSPFADVPTKWIFCRVDTILLLKQTIHKILKSKNKINQHICNVQSTISIARFVACGLFSLQWACRAKIDTGCPLTWKTWKSQVIPESLRDYVYASAHYFHGFHASGFVGPISWVITAQCEQLKMSLVTAIK